MSQQENIARIRAVHGALGELAKDVVFIGGATVALYADRPATDIRPTDDIDIVVEITSYKEFAAIEGQLKSKGFINDAESKVICRYKVNGITVDVLPTEEKVLGFNNCWYPEAFKFSTTADLGNDCIVNIFTAVYFIASKLDAFSDRGAADGRMSSDFEDIVFVLNHRTTIWDELANAPEDLKQYFKEQFGQWFANEEIYEWVSAHLEYSEQRRVGMIVEGLRESLGI